MKARLAALKARFASARADADAAQRDVRQASARRLAELQALDGKALVAGLKDPALTPQDREQLARTIAERLPRRARRVPQSLSQPVFAAFRHARYRWRGLAMTAVVASALAGFFAIAAHRSGREIVRFDTATRLTFTFADGHNGTWDFAPGDGLVVTQRSADAVRLRFWDPQFGYGTTDIRNDWVVLHTRN